MHGIGVSMHMAGCMNRISLRMHTAGRMHSIGHMKKDIGALGKVQKTATKILPHLKYTSYSDRLKACKLPTIHYRRI